MKRSDKVALLTRVLTGGLPKENLRALLSPAPQSVSGVLVVKDAQPQPEDIFPALITLPDGRRQDRSMTYEEFCGLPPTVDKTLFILPTKDS